MKQNQMKDRKMGRTKSFFPRARLARIVAVAWVVAGFPVYGGEAAGQADHDGAKEAQETARDSRRPSDVLRDMLANKEQEGVVAIGESYGDSCSANSVDETIRAECVEGAYLNALADIVRQTVGAQFTAEEGPDGETTHISSEFLLFAPRVVGQSEAFMKDGIYGMAVAVTRSLELESRAKDLVAGSGKEGKNSEDRKLLEQWLSGFRQSSTVELGPRLLLGQDKGIEWLLGIAACDLDDEAFSKPRLQADACRALECSLGGQVRARSSMATRPRTGETESATTKTSSAEHKYIFHAVGAKVDDESMEEVLDESIVLEPVLKIPDSSLFVEWHEWTAQNPKTGRPVRIAVAALAAKDVRRYLSPAFPLDKIKER